MLQRSNHLACVKSLLSGANRVLWVGEAHIRLMWGLLMCDSGIDNTTPNGIVCFGKVHNPRNDKLRTTMVEWLRGLICRYLEHYSPWHSVVYTSQWTLAMTSCVGILVEQQSGSWWGFSPGHYSPPHSVVYTITMTMSTHIIQELFPLVEK